MKYSINFEKHYKNGKFEHFTWHDDNIFNTHYAAMLFAFNMIEFWKKEDNELITFNIISH